MALRLLPEEKKKDSSSESPTVHIRRRNRLTVSGTGRRRLNGNQGHSSRRLSRVKMPPFAGFGRDESGSQTGPFPSSESPSYLGISGGKSIKCVSFDTLTASTGSQSHRRSIEFCQFCWRQPPMVGATWRRKMDASHFWSAEGNSISRITKDVGVNFSTWRPERWFRVVLLPTHESAANPTLNRPFVRISESNREGSYYPIIYLQFMLV